MAKYEIKTISLDEFELRYKKDDKEVVLPFKRTVDLAVKLQSVEADARFEMFDYLTKMGKTKKDLVIERKTADGKIVVDESNYREFEAGFILNAQYKWATNLYKSLFNMTMEQMIAEIGLEQEEAYLFGVKIREILLNGNDDKTPSNNSNESISAKE